MAAASHVTSWVYGMIHGGPPYTGSNPFARQIDFPTPVQMSFDTSNTIFHPTSQGIRFGNYYVYSVIEQPASGLNQPSTKYASGDSVATLATAAS